MVQTLLAVAAAALTAVPVVRAHIYPNVSHVKTSAETTSFTSTFSIATSSSAPSTTALPTIDNGLEYVKYSTVGGYFLQDSNSTEASTFDYVCTSFSTPNKRHLGGINKYRLHTISV